MEEACAAQLAELNSTLDFNKAQASSEQNSEPSNKSAALVIQNGVKCPEHPDEDLNYFCEDCCSGPHCSECVVHGLHKGHRVMTLKNAYGIIREKIDLQLKSVTKKISLFESYNTGYESEKDHLVSDTLRIKSQLENEFNEIEKMLVRKKDILCQNIDKLMTTEVAKIDTEKEKIVRRCIELEKNRDILDECLKNSDKITITDFFVNKFQEICQSYETDPKMDSPHEKSAQIEEISTKNELILKEILAELKQISSQIAEMPGFAQLKNTPGKSPGSGRMRPKAESQKIFQKNSPAQQEMEGLFETFGGGSSRRVYARTQQNDMKKSIVNAYFTVKKDNVKALTNRQSGNEKSPLKSLELIRMKKITASPSYRKYQQMKSLGKL